jgi:hypothetical protein
VNEFPRRVRKLSPCSIPREIKKRSGTEIYRIADCDSTLEIEDQDANKG